MINETLFLEGNFSKMNSTQIQTQVKTNKKNDPSDCSYINQSTNVQLINASKRHAVDRARRILFTCRAAGAFTHGWCANLEKNQRMFHVTHGPRGASEASDYCSGDFSMFFLGFKTLGKNCLKEMPKEIIGEAVQSWKYSSNCHPKKMLEIFIEEIRSHKYPIWIVNQCWC